MTRLTLEFVGDISLNDNYNKLLTKENANFPFEKIKTEFHECDALIGNLESPLVSSDCLPAFKMKTPLRGDPSYAEALSLAGFKILNLSNNHILDYGERALEKTLTLLEEHGIMHFGYGANINCATELKTVSLKDYEIGFMGYTDVDIDSPFFAGPDKRGIVKFDIDEASRETVKNKKLVDFLVISLHWGIEYFHLPTTEQIDHARRLIDGGADIIIGHHPHVLQGIERYKNGIIAYSLGNFIFSEILWEWYTPEGEKRLTKYPLKRSYRKGIILKIEIENGTIGGYQVIGTLLKKSGQVHFHSHAENDVDILSKKLKNTDYKKYFQHELRKFNRNQIIGRQLRRLLRFYKIRPKHLREFYHLISHSE